jgi:hypothetical protein
MSVPGSFEVWAWVGEDELGSGGFGLKQAVVPAGTVPLVAVRRNKLDRPDVRTQLQAQVDHWGKPIHLVRMVLAERADVIHRRDT